jgi:hypothetical protein
MKLNQPTGVLIAALLGMGQTAKPENFRPTSRGVELADSFTAPVPVEGPRGGFMP